MLDDGVQEDILGDMMDQMNKDGEGTSSFELEFDEYVGWSSTDDLRKYSTNELEIFSPNRRSTGLRVKKDLVGVFAPKTKLVTVVYELKCERNDLVAVVHSIYPGHDIGELYGDVSEREKVVFFDWNHPGQK